MPMPTSPLARLGAFRTELHACYTCRADALVELGDALLCPPTFSPLPHPRLGAAPPEPGTGPPARLGQRLRRPSPRPHPGRAAARSAGRDPARSRPAGVRGGCDHLAALRRRMLPRARLLLPSLAPLRRPADHRRLGLPVDHPAGLRPRLLDRPGRRGAAAPLGRHRTDRRRAGPGAAWPAGRGRPRAAVRLGRRVRLRPVIPRPGGPARGGAGAAAILPLLLRRPAPTPPRPPTPA